MGRVSRAAWIYIAAVVIAAASVVAPKLSGRPMSASWLMALGVLMLPIAFRSWEARVRDEPP